MIDMSIELYDAAAESACVLNKRDDIKIHVQELVAHAKTFDDSLHCKLLVVLCVLYEMFTKIYPVFQFQI